MMRCSGGIVNLSQSELFEGVTANSKPLKVRHQPRTKTLIRQAKPVKLTMPLDVTIPSKFSASTLGSTATSSSTAIVYPPVNIGLSAITPSSPGVI